MDREIRGHEICYSEISWKNIGKRTSGKEEHRGRLERDRPMISVGGVQVLGDICRHRKRYGQ